MKPSLENLITIRAAGAGFDLGKEQAAQLAVYLEELKTWNKQFNLISRTECDDCELVNKHLIDSMAPLLSRKISPTAKIVDVGTGAGLPGLILKVLEPGLDLTLLESVSKKCAFLEHVVERIGLSRVRVVCERAESFGRGEGRAQFDVAVARALAPLPSLLELCLPLLRPGGYLLAQKGQKVFNEAEQAKAAASILGGKIEEIKGPTTEVPRALVIVKKVGSTPAHYPRRPGIPSKRPLTSRAVALKKDATRAAKQH